MWSIDQRQTKVKCIDCWKEIIRKWQRVRCIKCSNARDREIAKQRRATQESKDYYKDYNHVRWENRKRVDD